MTQNEVMEELSRDYILTLAHCKGYYAFDGRDHGVDLTIRYADRRSENGKGRYMTSGRCVDIQLKAVGERYINYNNSSIGYALEAKNFNDLVERRGDIYTPLILIVFVVPDDANTWVESVKEGVLSRKEAYWFMPGIGSPKTPNTSKTTISISSDNKLGKNFFPELFKQLF